MYKLIIKFQGVKPNQYSTELPKNHNKNFFFVTFFQKARAWLSIPTPKCQNVLIVSQRATAPASQKAKTTNTTKHKKNIERDTKTKKLTQTI